MIWIGDRERGRLAENSTDAARKHARSRGGPAAARPPDGDAVLDRRLLQEYSFGFLLTDSLSFLVKQPGELGCRLHSKCSKIF